MSLLFCKWRSTCYCYYYFNYELYNRHRGSSSFLKNHIFSLRRSLRTKSVLFLSFIEKGIIIMMYFIFVFVNCSLLIICINNCKIYKYSIYCTITLFSYQFFYSSVVTQITELYYYCHYIIIIVIYNVSARNRDWR